MTNQILAGMPIFRLTDVAHQRLEVLSFFGVAFFVCSLVFMLLWNAVGKGWPAWPRIGYLRALGIMLVFGLLGYLILTMISGARELMTPGAWKKEGATYSLSTGEDAKRTARRQVIRKLRTELWNWAGTHDFSFPDRLEDLPNATELLPKGYTFKYAPQMIGSAEPLLVEDLPAEEKPLTLLANGILQ